MRRDDLASLTADDLTALSNRGNVKRAERELEEGAITVELTENDDGEVVARWSDGPVCRIPAGAAPRDAACSCPATGFCRHLVRTVLAYQARLDRQDVPAAAAEPWDPGFIEEGQLEQAYRKPMLAKIKSRFDEGMLVELVRSAKPTVHFDEEGCTVRFLLKGDVRYTHCDCDEPAPCRHVAMAVWAFRRLPTDKPAGLLSTHKERLPVPESLLDEIETGLRRFCEDGLSGTSNVRRDQFRRLEARCEQEGLVWIGDILGDLVQEHERYQEHDARFAPLAIAELAGELVIRSDAVRSDTDIVPQLLIRGSRHDRLTPMGQSRLVGLGCGATLLRKAVELSAYLQDADSGTVIVVTRQFADPEPDDKSEPKPLARLAQTPVVAGASLATLGSGQLLIQGGKRAANRRFLPGRARAAVHPENYQWEKLRAPVLAEDFGELRARLSAAPPASLRARRLTEDFFVCPIAAVESAHFDSVSQAVTAVVRDEQGAEATLWHPYWTRGKDGAEALLAALGAHAERLKFVAGQVRLRASQLVLHPTCLVFEEGGTRKGVQPWIDSPPSEVDRPALPEGSGARGVAADPLGEVPRQLLQAVGELLVCGLRNADAPTARRWREVARSAESAGLTRLAGRIAVLADHLEAKLSTTRWDATPACDALLQVSALAKLAADLA